MKNFEKWEKEIREITDNKKTFGLYEGVPVPCSDIKCSTCDFTGKEYAYDFSCIKAKYAWLFSEYVEKPKLTKQERKFCELFTYKNLYIARDNVDCYETLHCYEGKPQKNGNQWEGRWFSVEPMMRRCGIEFSFIKGTDQEPWAVSDLLKLEVFDT